MAIHNITIKNVRGIAQLSINSTIRRNKPNILVAPNGFGKTSIATAFKSAAEQTSIKLKDEARHGHDDTRKAKIELEVEEDGSTSNLSATEQAHSNSIRKHFDIQVVSDLRRIKSHSRNFGGFQEQKQK